MAQQRVNVFRALHAALLLVVALIAVASLVAMHSVAASAVTDASTGVNSSAANIPSDAGAEPAASAQPVTHTDVTPHDLDSPSVEVCPCSSGSAPSMVAAECSTPVSLSGPTVVASLRVQCAEFAPLSPLTVQRTGAVAQPTAPSLHFLSISRT